MKIKYLCLYALSLLYIVPFSHGKDIDILILSSEQSLYHSTQYSATEFYRTKITEEVESLFSGHADYASGSVSVTWAGLNSNTDGMMEAYHHPTYKAGHIALMDHDYDYVVLIDDPGNVAFYEEYHFEGIYQFSKRALAMGAIPIVLSPYASNATEGEEWTEMTYRVAQGCGIGVAPAGEALYEAGLFSQQVTADELFYLVAASIFSSITSSNAKSSGYVPPSWVDKNDLGDTVMAVLNDHLNTDQYVGDYNRKGHMKLRQLVESDLHNNQVGYAYSGTSTEDGISTQLTSLIASHSDQAHSPLRYKIGTTRQINPTVFNAAKSTLKSAANYDNFYMMYARDIEMKADDIINYTGDGTTPVQPNISCFFFDKQDINTSSGAGLLPIDDLAKNIAWSYDYAYWVDLAQYSGWQMVGFHLAGARLYELKPTLHPYRDWQHLSDPYSMLAASLMHTYATGLPLKYRGADANFRAAIELGAETARQLSYLTETGEGMADSDLRIATQAIPTMYVGSIYSATLSASAGTAPYTWSLVGGDALPSGLSLSTSGALSGTPSKSVKAGDYTFVFRVKDSAGAIWKMPYRVSVSATRNPFDQWMDANTSLSGNSAGLLSDPDGDGVANFMEYAIGSDPEVQDATSPLQIRADGADYIVEVPTAQSLSAVDYTLEFSENLTDWTLAPIAVTAGHITNQRATIRQPRAGKNKLFVRLRVSPR